MKAEQDYRELSKEALDQIQDPATLAQAYRMIVWLLQNEGSPSLQPRKF